MTTSEIATVLAWQDALNTSDIETLVALSSDDIEVGDAHGAAQGHDALRTWATARPRAAEVGRIYVHDGVVVVEQLVVEQLGGDDPGADTPGADTPGANTPGANTPGANTPGANTPGSNTPGSNTPVATAFRVVHDHVTSVFCHRDVAAALAATDLTEADLVD